MIDRTNERVTDKSIIQTSMIVGLILNGNFIVNTISHFVKISSLYAVYMISLGMICLLVNKSVPIISNKKVFLCVIVIFLQFFFSIWEIGNIRTNHFFQCFIAIGLPCCLIGMNNFEEMIACKTVIVSSLVCAANYYYINTGTYNVYNSGEQMGLAYSLLPPIMVSIIVLLGTDNKKWRIVSIFTILLSVFSLFKLMTRGAYICLLAFIFFVVALNIKTWLKRKTSIIGVMLGISLIMFLMLRYPIYESAWYHHVFGLKSENILNGREIDIEALKEWRGMWKSFWGSGIGSYKANTGNDYIHNIFGQVYYEQGIYSAFFLLLIIISSIKSIIKRQVNNRLLLALIAVSVLRLQMSYYYWIDATFWLFIGVSMSQSDRIKALNNAEREIDEKRKLSAGFNSINNI